MVFKAAKTDGRHSRKNRLDKCIVEQIGADALLNARLLETLGSIEESYNGRNVCFILKYLSGTRTPNEKFMIGNRD